MIDAWWEKWVMHGAGGILWFCHVSCSKWWRSVTRYHMVRSWVWQVEYVFLNILRVRVSRWVWIIVEQVWLRNSCYGIVYGFMLYWESIVYCRNETSYIQNRKQKLAPLHRIPITKLDRTLISSAKSIQGWQGTRVGMYHITINPVDHDIGRPTHPPRFLSSLLHGITLIYWLAISCSCQWISKFSNEMVNRYGAKARQIDMEYDRKRPVQYAYSYRGINNGVRLLCVVYTK